MKKIHWGVVLAGVAVGLAALILTAMGNPANMGFCIACFLRDTAAPVACTAPPRCSTSVRRSSASCSARSS